MTSVMNICHVPWFEYCSDMFIAGEVLDFLEFHKKYRGGYCSLYLIVKSIKYALSSEITLSDVETALDELRQINLVEKFGSAYKLTE